MNYLIISYIGLNVIKFNEMYGLTSNNDTVSIKISKEIISNYISSVQKWRNLWETLIR